MNTISPGVYRKITDLRAYVDAVPSTVGMIAILSERGRDNVLQFISSQKQLLTEYGLPDINKYGQGLYNADNFLQHSQSLYVIRVTDPNSSYAALYVTLDPTTGKFTTKSYTNLNSVDEIETKLVDPTDTPFIAFYGIGRGTFYNKVGVCISPSASLIGIDGYNVDIYVEDDNQDMVLTESFVVTLGRINYNGKSLFIEDVINTHSQFVNCRVNDANIREYLDFLSYAKQGVPNQYSGSIPFFYNMGTTVIYTKIEDAFNVPFLMLQNGTDGNMYNADGSVNWTTAEQYLAQAYLGTVPHFDPTVVNNEIIYFSVVFDADYPDGVKDAIKVLCEIRGDCVGILDNGYHSGPYASQDAVNDASGVHDYNSFYVALYEGDQLVYDPYTGREIWVSPSYFMSKVIPHNDYMAEPWFAPAGYRRAALSGIRKSAHIPTKGERDQYYMVQLNPIAKLKNGYVVLGQQTKYPVNSALRDLNIVRLLFYIDAALSNFALYYLFEQNDEFTWNDFRDKISGFLKDIVDRRGLRSFKIDVGATDYELQTDTFHADIYLVAVSTVEKIFLNYTVTKS